MNTTIPARPKRSDDAVIAAAAKKLAPAVREWLNDETELKDIEADLAQAMKYDSDGYDIARHLDGQYSPDAALVEILDGAGYAKISASSKAEAEWVKANNLQPPAIGSMVSFTGRYGITAGGVVSGEVTKNHPDGKSTIFCASQGHVREGVGTHGTIIEWERLTPETAPTPATE